MLFPIDLGNRSLGGGTYSSSRSMTAASPDQRAKNLRWSLGLATARLANPPPSSPLSLSLSLGIETTIQSDSRMDTTSYAKEVIVQPPLKDQNKLTTLHTQFVLVECQAENKVFRRLRRLHQTFSVKCVNSHFLLFEIRFKLSRPICFSCKARLCVPQTHLPGNSYRRKTPSKPKNVGRFDSRSGQI